MVLSVKHETRCGEEEGEKGDEILSTDRPAVAPWRHLRALHCKEQKIVKLRQGWASLKGP